VFQVVQVVSPPLHHLFSVYSIFTPMVSGSDGVLLPVGQLIIGGDSIRIESSLVSNGAE
jgi:hypothetical protein